MANLESKSRLNLIDDENTKRFILLSQLIDSIGKEVYDLNANVRLKRLERWTENGEQRFKVLENGRQR